MVLSTLDGTIVSTALPTITHELGHESLRSWVITSYLLAQVATMPLYGKLGDLYGRKRVFIIAISIFTVGLDALGRGGLDGAAPRLARAAGHRRRRHRFARDGDPRRHRPRPTARALARLPGRDLRGREPHRPAHRRTLRRQPLVAVGVLREPPFAAASIFIVGTKLHLPHQPIRHALDYAGAALITLALACIVLAASIGGQTNDWGSTEVLGLVAAVVVLSILFVARERRAPEPVLPLRLLTSRVVRIAAGLNTTSGATFAAGIYFIPVFVQQVKGASATESGFLLVPFMFTTAFTTLLAGRAVERTGRYRTWPILGSVIATAGVLLLTTLGIDTPVWLIAIYGAVLGMGVGFVMQTSLLALQNGAEQRDLGVATSSALLCAHPRQHARRRGVQRRAPVAAAVGTAERHRLRGRAPLRLLRRHPGDARDVRARAASPAAQAPREHPIRLRAAERRGGRAGSARGRGPRTLPEGAPG